MKTTFLLTIISALLLSTGVASAATREYEGTVVSVNRDAKTFRLHDSERGTIRIKVRRSTRFERISGFSGLRKGQRNIEATVKRVNGRWVATRSSAPAAAASTAATTTTTAPTTTAAAATAPTTS